MDDLVARAKRWSPTSFGGTTLKSESDELKLEAARSDKIELPGAPPLRKSEFGPRWLDTHAVGGSGHVVDASSLLKANGAQSSDPEDKAEQSEYDKEVKKEEAKGRKPTAAPGSVVEHGMAKSTDDIVQDLRKSAEELRKAEEQANATTGDVSFTAANWGKVIGRAGLSHKDATKAGSVWVWSAPGIRIASTYNPKTQTAPGGMPMPSGTVTLSGDKSKVEMCFKDIEKYSSKGE